MKKFMLLCVVVLSAALLTGCSTAPEQENTTPTVSQQDPLSVPPKATELPYDPMAEEDGDTYVPGQVYDEYGNSLYAGATPIPLDPVDMPTPTPRPALAFSYTPVQLADLGIQFEAPQGWYMDNTVPGTVKFVDPNTYDNVQGYLTISISSVASNYKLANVKTTLSEKLEEISRSYIEWRTYQADSRTLMDRDGYYNNYRGVKVDGSVVRGRVMIALLENNKIITVDLCAPGWYNESYMNILNKFRDTLKAL